MSPLKSMLNEARAEIAKLGVSLAILRGGTLEQQATLRAWQGGSYKGLLSDPDLPALNLSEASVVVFLSPLLTDTQFAQATGRVVRQGSFHENVRVIVMAADGHPGVGRFGENRTFSARSLASTPKRHHPPRTYNDPLPARPYQNASVCLFSGVRSQNMYARKSARMKRISQT